MQYRSTTSPTRAGRTARKFYSRWPFLSYRRSLIAFEIGTTRAREGLAPMPRSPPEKSHRRLFDAANRTNNAYRTPRDKLPRRASSEGLRGTTMIAYNLLGLFNFPSSSSAIDEAALSAMNLFAARFSFYFCFAFLFFHFFHFFNG